MPLPTDKQALGGASVASGNAQWGATKNPTNSGAFFMGKAGNQSNGILEDESTALLNKLDPYNGIQKGETGMYPFWSTGSRSLIKLRGLPLAICTSFQWTVAYAATPIFTIDSVHPWDIDIGPVNIQATLQNLFDPTKGPESFGLFQTMQSAIHQPLIEMQVLDKLGTCLFFARGMFVGVSGSVSQGQVSNLTAQFSGVAYQHYVGQKFKAYDSVGGALSNVAAGLKGLASKASGGML